MKRFRPRAKGRASAIKKPFSRITIVLGEKKVSKKENKKENKIEIKKDSIKETKIEVKK